MSIIKDLYKDLPCYIVGKGPSILNLDESYFPNEKAPIISIYQATHKVENLKLNNPIYSLQKDGCHSSNGKKPAPIGHTCNNTSMFKPKVATVLLYEKESKNCLLDYSNRIVFSLQDIDLKVTHKYIDSFSLECAIYIAIKWGCFPINLLCCDSCVNNNMETLEFEPTLSFNYRKQKTFDFKNYPIFCDIIKKHLEKYEHEWILPTKKLKPDLTNDDTMVQSNSTMRE